MWKVKRGWRKWGPGKHGEMSVSGDSSNDDGKIEGNAQKGGNCGKRFGKRVGNREGGNRGTEDKFRGGEEVKPKHTRKQAHARTFWGRGEEEKEGK